MNRTKPAEVADFIITCLNHEEADGYQSFETGEDDEDGCRILGSLPGRDVTFGYHTRQSLWVKVGDQEFIVKVTQRRK